MNEEQQGNERAVYGENLILILAEKLKSLGIRGYGATNLKLCRLFHLEYPFLIDGSISHALRDEFKTGHFTSDLSWTHNRSLLKASNPAARSFYEIESLHHSWSAPELDRQINSLLFERLVKSRDKEGLLRLANQGLRPQQPADIFKNPVVIEFLGLPELEKLVESDLENALGSQIQLPTDEQLIAEMKRELRELS